LLRLSYASLVGEVIDDPCGRPLGLFDSRKNLTIRVIIIKSILVSNYRIRRINWIKFERISSLIVMIMSLEYQINSVFFLSKCSSYPTARECGRVGVGNSEEEIETTLRRVYQMNRSRARHESIANSELQANGRKMRDFAFLIAGLGIGSGVALLLAPAEGEDMRYAIRRGDRAGRQSPSCLPREHIGRSPRRPPPGRRRG